MAALRGRFFPVVARSRVPVLCAGEAMVSGTASAEGRLCGENCGKHVPPDAGGSRGAEPGIAKVFFVGLRAGGRSLSRGCMEHVWLNGACGPDACKSVPERTQGEAGTEFCIADEGVRPCASCGWCDLFPASALSARRGAAGGCSSEENGSATFFWGGESCAVTCPQERAACPGRGCGPAPGGNIQ